MPNDQNHQVCIYNAAGVIDAQGCYFAPGALGVYQGMILGAGKIDDVERQVNDWITSAGFDILPQFHKYDYSKYILIPSLVNAHVHLDLTSIGFEPFNSTRSTFLDWVKMIISNRPVSDKGIHDAVEEGIALSLAAGVLRVGDIAGTATAQNLLMKSELKGVSYLELFGLGGATLEQSLEVLEKFVIPSRETVDEEAGEGAVGFEKMLASIQPHAPYSAGSKLYQATIDRLKASKRPMTFATHLAETLEEQEFVATGTGVFRELLESLGKWDDDYLADYAEGQHPVAWLTAILAKAIEETEKQKSDDDKELDESMLPYVVAAHCNKVDDHMIGLLALGDMSVVYCPRASAYFGHQGHRYEGMLEAGVNVCLGTDSIVCHGSLSILDEMRFLYQRDKVDPMMLLKMATVNGLQAIRPDINLIHATFKHGAKPGVLAVGISEQQSDNHLQAILASTEAFTIKVLENIA